MIKILTIAAVLLTTGSGAYAAAPEAVGQALVACCSVLAACCETLMACCG